jgi:single-stranded-DNA-specific exonuclease
MAGGFSIEMKKMDEFKNFLFERYSRLAFIDNYIKNLYLDSTIYPSALNEDFYKKIFTLAPFGSGNTEPKFVIQNLRVVNSSILAEKHIKSILLSKSDIKIKTIAFNSIGSPLESYLTHKNNRYFNIAGKMSMNEWKGENKIEFIIDDISVN